MEGVCTHPALKLRSYKQTADIFLLFLCLSHPWALFTPKHWSALLAQTERQTEKQTDRQTERRREWTQQRTWVLGLAERRSRLQGDKLSAIQPENPRGFFFSIYGSPTDPSELQICSLCPRRLSEWEEYERFWVLVQCQKYLIRGQLSGTRSASKKRNNVCLCYPSWSAVCPSGLWY